jgi:antitoxin (DNA-binding transcriptional repressor) of toxin-antitoxin stability system
VSCDHVNLTTVMKHVSDEVVSKSRFKSKALEYFRQVEKSGKAIIITDRGKPVLKVAPFSEDPEETLKELRNSVVKYKDATKPVGESDWTALS